MAARTHAATGEVPGDPIGAEGHDIGSFLLEDPCDAIHLLIKEHVG
jgi:hypothetical protein